MKKMRARRRIPKKSRTPLRRYSPREQQDIMNLADSLCQFLPATSRGDYSLQNIARKAGLAKYFELTLGNKRKQFIHFIKQVYGRHRRKFKAIINNILAEAVEWRRSKGNPILRPEAETVKSRLYALGIDLRKEIDDLQLPEERPRITPPPIGVKQALEKFGLHPVLLDKVFPLFADGHVNEAVRKAGEIYEVIAARAIPGQQRYGRDLMSHVFNSKNPIIDISGFHSSDTLNPTDEKEGYMYLAMGAMHWCKNVVGHGDVNQLDPHDAAARIILISHLIHVAESRQASASPETSTTGTRV
jgi:uncharacterized protein (TIGR02391 family)